MFTSSEKEYCINAYISIMECFLKYSMQLSSIITRFSLIKFFINGATQYCDSSGGI